MSEPALLTLAEAARRLEAGTVTSVELVDACLARITALAPALNAFIAVEADAARAAALASDARRRSGWARGPALASMIGGMFGQVDALLCPVAASAAPRIDETDVGGSPRMAAVLGRITRYTRPFNYLSLPALSVPAGFTPEGLPVGMQLVGRPYAEGVLLRLGRAYEREARRHDLVPGTGP